MRERGVLTDCCSPNSTKECNSDERNLCTLKVAHIGSAFTSFATIEKNVGRVHTKRLYATHIHHYTSANVDKQNIKYKTNAHIAYTISRSLARSYTQTFVNSHILYKYTLALGCTEYNKSDGRSRRRANYRIGKEQRMISSIRALTSLNVRPFFTHVFLFHISHCIVQSQEGKTHRNRSNRNHAKTKHTKAFICQSEGNPKATATTLANHICLWDFQEKLNCEKTLRLQRV